MNLFNKARDDEEKDGAKNCIYCGAVFEPKKADLNRGWGLYCSKSCAVIWKNENRSSNKLKRKSMNRDKKLNQLGI